MGVQNLEKRKFGFILSFVFAISMIVGACGTATEKISTEGYKQEKENFTVAMVTDIGGVEDRSFNQSAWEGIQSFGEDHGLERGKDGYNYLQSKSDADYTTNLNTLVREEYSLVFAIGFALAESVADVASQRPEAKFAIVDEVVEKDNVVSVTFKEHEGSFLVGVIAGLQTKTNKIGFVGGMEDPVIKKFEAGFIAGVKSVNPKANVIVEYAGSFNDVAKGKSIASSMYASGTDIIYHASGATGNGVFAEAKDLKKKDPSREIYVIGVDRDQHEEGAVTVNDKQYNITLTSMVKRVDVAVKDLATKAKNGKFPGGKRIVYGIEQDGIKIADSKDNVSKEALIAVAEWTEKIKSGEQKVPATVGELKDMKFKDVK